MMMKMDIFVRNFAGSVLYKCQREDLEGIYPLDEVKAQTFSKKKKEFKSKPCRYFVLVKLAW